MASLRQPIPGLEQPGEFKPGLPGGNPYAMTNTGTLGSLPNRGPAPVPLQIPGATNYQAPQTPQFGGQAPVSTPFGDFRAPNPADVANDPYYQFRVAEGQKGLEHSAAARGMLASGGTLKSLERFRQGLASEEAGKAFDRATTAYGLNRGTNAQNFGQQMDTFHGGLDAFRTNADTGINYGRLGLDTSELNNQDAWRRAQATQGNAQEQADYNASLVPPAPGLSEYAQTVGALNRVPASMFGPSNALTSGGLPSRVPSAARLSGARR